MMAATEHSSSNSKRQSTFGPVDLQSWCAIKKVNRDDVLIGNIDDDALNSRLEDHPLNGGSGYFAWHSGTRLIKF